MKRKENYNNHVVLCGKIRGEFTFNHRDYRERFYRAEIEVARLSGNTDTIPVVVSNRLANTRKKWNGKTVCIEGEICSFMSRENGNSRMSVFALARYFSECEEDANPENSVFLEGYISKPPLYRETPLGREITDVLLAVNRPGGKSDYVPCIFWGRNASFAVLLEVGDRIRIKGRMQSREYRKQVSDEEYIERTVYEASVSSLEVVSRAETKDD